MANEDEKSANLADQQADSDSNSDLILPSLSSNLNFAAFDFENADTNEKQIEEDTADIELWDIKLLLTNIGGKKLQEYFEKILKFLSSKNKEIEFSNISSHLEELLVRIVKCVGILDSAWMNDTCRQICCHIIDKVKSKAATKEFILSCTYKRSSEKSESQESENKVLVYKKLYYKEFKKACSSISSSPPISESSSIDSIYSERSTVLPSTDDFKSHSLHLILNFIKDKTQPVIEFKTLTTEEAEFVTFVFDSILADTFDKKLSVPLWEVQRIFSSKYVFSVKCKSSCRNNWRSVVAEKKPKKVDHWHQNEDEDENELSENEYEWQPGTSRAKRKKSKYKTLISRLEEEFITTTLKKIVNLVKDEAEASATFVFKNVEERWFLKNILNFCRSAKIKAVFSKGDRKKFEQILKCVSTENNYKLKLKEYKFSKRGLAEIIFFKKPVFPDKNAPAPEPKPDPNSRQWCKGNINSKPGRPKRFAKMDVALVVAMQKHVILENCLPNMQPFLPKTMNVPKCSRTDQLIEVLSVPVQSDEAMNTEPVQPKTMHVPKCSRTDQLIEALSVPVQSDEAINTEPVQPKTINVPKCSRTDQLIESLPVSVQSDKEMNSLTNMQPRPLMKTTEPVQLKTMNVPKCSRTDQHIEALSVPVQSDKAMNTEPVQPKTMNVPKCSRTDQLIEALSVPVQSYEAINTEPVQPKNMNVSKCSRTEQLIEALSVPVQSDKAIKMMKSMGWTGGGLGSKGEGITEPLMPHLSKGSGAGLGHKKSKRKTVSIPPIAPLLSNITPMFNITPTPITPPSNIDSLSNIIAPISNITPPLSNITPVTIPDQPKPETQKCRVQPNLPIAPPLSNISPTPISPLSNIVSQPNITPPLYNITPITIPRKHKPKNLEIKKFRELFLHSLYELIISEMDFKVINIGNIALDKARKFLSNALKTFTARKKLTLTADIQPLVQQISAVYEGNSGLNVTAWIAPDFVHIFLKKTITPFNPKETIDNINLHRDLSDTAIYLMGLYGPACQSQKNRNMTEFKIEIILHLLKFVTNFENQYKIQIGPYMPKHRKYIALVINGINRKAKFGGTRLEKMLSMQFLTITLKLNISLSYDEKYTELTVTKEGFHVSSMCKLTHPSTSAINYRNIRTIDFVESEDNSAKNDGDIDSDDDLTESDKNDNDNNDGDNDSTESKTKSYEDDSSLEKYIQMVDCIVAESNQDSDSELDLDNILDNITDDAKQIQKNAFMDAIEKDLVIESNINDDETVSDDKAPKIDGKDIKPNISETATPTQNEAKKRKVIKDSDEIEEASLDDTMDKDLLTDKESDLSHVIVEQYDNMSISDISYSQNLDISATEDDISMSDPKSRDEACLEKMYTCDRPLELSFNYEKTQETLNVDLKPNLDVKIVFLTKEYPGDMPKHIQGLLSLNIVLAQELPLLKCHGVQNGALIYSCHTKKSFEWLESVCATNNIILSTKEFDKMSVKINLFIDFDEKYFFNMLELYNQDICTKDWTVLKKNVLGNSVIFEIKMDKKSFKFILDSNLELYSGVDKVTFSIIWE